MDFSKDDAVDAFSEIVDIAKNKQRAKQAIDGYKPTFNGIIIVYESDDKDVGFHFINSNFASARQSLLRAADIFLKTEMKEELYGELDEGNL